MRFKNKLCKMRANLKYKLAELFCRNFALQSRNIAKTILIVSIESKEMNSSRWKNSFNIFCEAKKWKCSNLNRQKSWIAVKLWRDWSQVIASFLEIKTFSSHSLMDCAVKQCIQHACSRLLHREKHRLVTRREPCPNSPPVGRSAQIFFGVWGLSF